MKRLLLIAGLLSLSQVGWATPTFTLIPPAGLITGGPGATIGWGVEIDNPDNVYLVVSSTEFVYVSGPGLGTYNDILGPNFTIIGPGTTSIAFDISTPAGLGSFTLNPGVNLLDLEVGHIKIYYNAYTDSGASTPTVVGDPTYTAVLDGSVMVVPEPGTLGVGGGTLVLLGFLRRRRQAN